MNNRQTARFPDGLYNTLSNIRHRLDHASVLWFRWNICQINNSYCLLGWQLGDWRGAKAGACIYQGSSWSCLHKSSATDWKNSSRKMINGLGKEHFVKTILGLLPFWCLNVQASLMIRMVFICRKIFLHKWLNDPCFHATSKCNKKNGPHCMMSDWTE